MRPLSLALIALLFLFAPFASAQYAEVKWVKVDEHQAALYLDGVQAGNVRDGVYFPYFGDHWGDAAECPVSIPAAYQPKPADPEDGGVIVSKVTPIGTHFGGEVPPVETPVLGKTAVSAAGETAIPRFERMGSITIVSADKATRERIAKDFRESAALAPWKDHRVKVYSPDSFALAPFKLAEDRTFAQTGVVLLVQPPPDENGKAPVRSIYAYDGPEETAGKLREIEADYDPNETGDVLWSRTHVGLGVGLGVTAVFSLLVGGLLKWLR